MRPGPFLLERYFARYEFTVPYLLCCSDCESVTIGDLLQMEQGAGDRFLALGLGYTESLGSPELRQEIASLYEHNKQEHILVHSGAEEAIFNFMNVMLNPGDHIIVHSPYYQSLGEVARSLGAEVAEWRGDHGGSWALDLNRLKNELTDRTKVVVVNFPHNPTGFLPEVDFIRQLSKLSDELGFIVFSDEVYRGLEYEPDRRLPPFADLNERAVSLGVMSKTYGLAGLRIGWIATRNEKIYSKLAHFKDFTTICNSAPSEFLAALALRHRESIVKRNLGIVQSNLGLLDDFFRENGELFKWRPPDAGPIAFPRYLGASIEQFCRELVREADVLLLPGSLYGEEGGFFRIGFGRKNLAEGLNRLDEYIRKWR